MSVLSQQTCMIRLFQQILCKVWIIIFMSKYKYSSLLSSQYRKVFKSYHSLDRHEKQLKQNMNRSLRKPLQTRYTTVSSHTHTYSDSHEYLNYSPLHISKPEPYLHYKTTEQYRHKMQATRLSLKHLRTGLKRQRQQTLPSSVVVTESRPERLRTQFSEYQREYDNGKINQSKEQINGLRNKDLIRSKDDRYEWMCFKNELSQKREYDVNWKKNDKKLMMRVNDVEKIRKKYNYIEKDSSCNEIGQNQAQDLRKEDDTYHNKPRNPLGQVNFNNLSHTHNRKQSQEQSVRTPHFHSTSTKHNSHPQASLISKKLQSLAKNTFTDRFQ